jgi:hypothetical protein
MAVEHISLVDLDPWQRALLAKEATRLAPSPFEP